MQDALVILPRADAWGWYIYCYKNSNRQRSRNRKIAQLLLRNLTIAALLLAVRIGNLAPITSDFAMLCEKIDNGLLITEKSSWSVAYVMSVFYVTLLNIVLYFRDITEFVTREKMKVKIVEIADRILLNGTKIGSGSRGMS